MRSNAFGWLLLAVASLGGTAWACPVCGGGGQNQQAFIDTMIFMSAMPLLMIGLLVGTVWHLAKKSAALEAAADSAPPTAEGAS